MVEFALVVPLLLLLVVGIFKFGVVYNHYIQLTNAVDAGAREFAVDRNLQQPPTPCDHAAARVIAYAGSNITVSPITISIPGNATWTQGGSAACPTLAQDDVATLSGQSSCDLVILGINLAPGCTLTASATESVQ